MDLPARRSFLFGSNNFEKRNRVWGRWGMGLGKTFQNAMRGKKGKRHLVE
jgi:hypothetical protein